MKGPNVHQFIAACIRIIGFIGPAFRETIHKIAVHRSETHRRQIHSPRISKAVLDQPADFGGREEGRERNACLFFYRFRKARILLRHLCNNIFRPGALPDNCIRYRLSVFMECNRRFPLIGNTDAEKLFFLYPGLRDQFPDNCKRILINLLRVM